MKKQLDFQQAEELAGALHRLQELRSKSVIEKGDKDDTEITALVEYIGPRLLEYADEFLGCWFAAKNEYAPLVQALAPVVRRCMPQPVPESGILMPRFARQKAADDKAQLKESPQAADINVNDGKIIRP